MKLEIEITRQDYLDFNVHHYRKTKLTKAVVVGLAGLFSLLFLINKNKSSLDDSRLFGPTVLYTLLYSSVIYGSLYNTRKIPADNGATLGKKKIDFDESGIHFQDAFSSGQYSWSAVKSMDEGKKTFNLYIDTNMAIVIPKRCFFSSTQEQEFRTLVQQNLSRA